MKTINKLAIYDSGLGGYSVFRDLHEHFPNLEMVLYADQRNAPYGNKSYEQLLDLAINAFDAMIKDGFEYILIACNTISATCLSTLKLMFPEINIMGIIDLTISQVEEGSVAVLATQATISSRVYQTLLHDVGEVSAIALPKLVDLIESLQSPGVINAYLDEFPLLSNPYDTIILACTHFPIIKDLLQQRYSAQIIDSRAPIRSKIGKSYLESNAGVHVKTSGDPQVMQEQIQTIFKENVEVKSWNL